MALNGHRRSGWRGPVSGCRLNRGKADVAAGSHAGFWPEAGILGRTEWFGF
jgi:hypothetical protein